MKVQRSILACAVLSALSTLAHAQQASNPVQTVVVTASPFRTGRC